jgi:TolB-like protein
MRQVILLGACVVLGGCVAPNQLHGYVPDPAVGPTYEQAAKSRLIIANHEAADVLLSQGATSLDRAKPILTATLVDLDNLKQSSRLGRLISEHIASRFTQRGLSVVEMKMRGSIFVQESEGELLLSREVQNISQSHSAQAVIVGTYARSQDYVYVTAKLVRSIDHVVLAAHNYVLPLDSNVSAMLSR